MKSLLLLLFLFFTLNTYAQKKGKQSRSSDIISELSYFWKIDSLGTNGFRLYTYEKVLNSKLDTLKPSVLINKFGNPNEVLESTKDVTYIYFYLNPTKMPSSFEAPNAIFYIGFIRNKHEKMIRKIIKWSFDL